MSRRVPGHTLRAEGAPYDERGRRLHNWGTSGVGRALCSCGAYSEELTTSTARKKWHREHKVEVDVEKNLPDSAEAAWAVYAASTGASELEFSVEKAAFFAAWRAHAVLTHLKALREKKS